MELFPLLLPLWGASLSLFCGRWLGYWAPRLTLLLISIALSTGLCLFAEVAFSHRLMRIDLFPWFDLSILRLVWSVQIDPLSSLMLLVVLSISFFVHLYSLGYMADDPHSPRFFGYLSLFTFFMVLLVVSPTLPQLFVGWEGVGLCSYLLISFWFTRRQATKSALKAIVINRLGDLGLLLAMTCLYWSTGTLDLALLLALAPSLSCCSITFVGFQVPLVSVVGLGLLVAAIGKSAQLGLHSWLPDAMEGPTPVSALIHAATMVTAGVFLLIRCFPLLEWSSFTLSIISLVGAVTALFGATVGLCQNDLKRVVAYSTCSQLGYMVFACGLSAPSIAVFHLYNHAFFKALLFLGAGAVIHGLTDEQDMRRMGGLVRLLPVTYSSMLVGSLALGGFPFLSGYYSKDLILEVAFASTSPFSSFSFCLGTLSAFLTSFYSFRLLQLTFLSPPRASRFFYNTVHEPPITMLVVLLLLSFLSMTAGFILRELIVGSGTDFWFHPMTLPVYLVQDRSEFLPLYFRLIPVIAAICGGFFSIMFHRFLLTYLISFWSGSFRFAYRFLVGRWFLDSLQNKMVVWSALRYGYVVAFRGLDRGVLELVGPTGVTRLVEWFSKNQKTFQSGRLHHYTFFLLSGLGFGLAALTGVFPIRLCLLWFCLAFFS